jgi:hypothetical protein
MPLAFFEWCEATVIGRAINDSVWLFGVIEAVHLLGLCLLGGSLLMLDLRMLGVGLSRQPVAEVARAVRPWQLRSLALMVMTGVPLFLSEAVKCYHNPSFWVKMSALPVALAFTLTIRQRTAVADPPVGVARSRLTAAGSLLLWFTVAAAGRWIGFSS